ncbi:MAG: sugar phosphate isomerase/epimerase [Firmicutes bacterium]|jgi:sugar phosphate isomerase/epimerase|nr:sugar phosphate isomerase/epimerase [Bacillota bacterium]
MMEKIYLQLYSFSDDRTLSMEDKLRMTAEIGFAGVEFAGGYEAIGVDEMKQMLRRYHLEAISAHVGVEAMSRSIPYMAELGAKMLIVPGYPFANRVEAVELATLLNRYGRECAAHGIRIGYHNHTSEFYLEDGKPLLDYVIENTDADYVSFELDCGWASAAGINPAEYIQTHPGRFVALHIKENSKVIGPDQPRSAHQSENRPRFERDAQGNPMIPEEMRRKFDERMQLDVATGTGIVDWKAIGKAAQEAGGLVYIIEREWSYSVPPDRVQCLKEDFAWVKQNL